MAKFKLSGFFHKIPGLIVSIVLSWTFLQGSVHPQPFLNSLAVLFRARPPWPTNFPASTQNPSTLFSIFPQSFQQFQPNNFQLNSGENGNNNEGQLYVQQTSSSPSQQGIFVAHPISANNFPPTMPRPPKFISVIPPTPTTSVFNVLKNDQNLNGGFKLSDFPQLFPGLTVVKTSPTPASSTSQPSSSMSPPSPPTIKLGDSISNFVHIPEPLKIEPSLQNNNFRYADPVAYPMLHNFKQMSSIISNTFNPPNAQKFIPQSSSNSLSPSPNSNSNHKDKDQKSSASSNSNQQQQQQQQSQSQNHNQIVQKEKPKPTLSSNTMTSTPFRPSPQISSFYETTVYQNIDKQGSSDQKSAGFEASEAKNGPRYEGGFRPVGHYPQYAPRHPIYTHPSLKSPNPHSAYNYPNPYMSTLPMSLSSSTTTVRNDYVQPLSHQKSGGKSGKKSKKGKKGSKKGSSKKGKLRKLHIFSNSGEDDQDQENDSTMSSSNEISGVRSPQFITPSPSTQILDSSESEESAEENSNHGLKADKFDLQFGFTSEPRAEKQVSNIAESSERIEDWLPPKLGKVRKSLKGPVYMGHVRKSYKDRLRPSAKCEKFHRFGFCPVTSNYPLAHVEDVASRCSALLTHLIAPLPKSDVRYDIMVSKNDSLKGRTARRISGARGWSWRSFRGKPVCDTEEIKVVPGWAKNEKGEWLVILQTHNLKQEAQISLCSPSGTDCSPGTSAEDCKSSNSGQPNKICVQRFTAQRLAVLDPENSDRCPVVRSVFLPSACVCLSDNSPKKRTHGQNSGEKEANKRSSNDAKEKDGVVDDEDPMLSSASNAIPVYSIPSGKLGVNKTYVVVSQKYSTSTNHTVSDKKSNL